MAGKKVERFEDLFVWQKSHQLVLQVYKATINFPKDELYVWFRKSDVPPFQSLPILPKDTESGQKQKNKDTLQLPMPRLKKLGII